VRNHTLNHNHRAGPGLPGPTGRSDGTAQVRQLPVTATKPEEIVITGDIPLNPPPGSLDAAREGRRVREHNEQVSGLVAAGFLVARNIRNDSPRPLGRGTYQLLTYLFAPKGGAK